MTECTSLKPIIKWAGGKTCIYKYFKNLLDFIDIDNIRYIDLFCGSLAIPCLLKPKRAIFNDINSSLINLYKIVKLYPTELLRELEILNDIKFNTKQKFLEMRTMFNVQKKTIDRLDKNKKVKHAALFIYLNKRCFNGLYRENSNGDFNVPYRESKTNIYEKDDIIRLSEYFNTNDILFYNESFESLCNKLHFNSLKTDVYSDIIYIDPPYFPCEKSSFTSYSKEPFLIKEQIKLSKLCKQLDKNGIRFILSNTPCDEIKEMYSSFNQYCFWIGRQMRSGKGKSDVYKKNEEANEILIWNYNKLIFFEN